MKAIDTADLPKAIDRRIRMWPKGPDGWKIIAAHVSMMPVGDYGS